MIPKHNRLTTKDINYIIKQWKRYHDIWRTYIWIPQYHNRCYHQISAQLSTKFHKHANIRNSCKRAIVDTAYQVLNGDQNMSHYIKLLIIPNKQSLLQRTWQLKLSSNQTHYSITTNLLYPALSSYQHILCSPSFTNNSKHSKPYGTLKVIKSQKN